MKRRFVPWLWLAALLMLTSCASLVGQRDVEIPLAKLQDAIANRFPFNNRYLELLDVRVTNPRVSLQPNTNRILTSMDTSIAPPFSNQAWTGSLAISGQLRVDPSRNALVLAEPRVENFAVNGLDSPFANKIVRVGALVAEQLLADMPLYTFQPNDFRYGGTNFFPTKITTKPNGLVVTFEPAR
ncbi:DUF1439 domain-containing protein [Noviherbaspirillum autotrophicum]|jgi:hypothetical protein|uniref:Membrane protein n=1 Tax=Noviherbaspirillum autotrophicum TaxID=709839 RepID=A0A0C2BR26_9BURK|nr:DUF1439 domain-containing protein [Noviherbaspirillum autotrophicum]KIF83755.1 membrane protein [Noviherbaspirillum autotrophicum]